MCLMVCGVPSLALSQSQSMEQSSVADEIPIISDIGYVLGWFDDQLDKAIAASEPGQIPSDHVEVSVPALGLAASAAPPAQDQSHGTGLSIFSEIENAFGWLDDQLDKAIAASEQQGLPQPATSNHALQDIGPYGRQFQKYDQEHNDEEADLMQRTHPLILVTPAHPNIRPVHEDGADGLLVSQDMKQPSAMKGQIPPIKMIRTEAARQTVKP